VGFKKFHCRGYIYFKVVINFGFDFDGCNRLKWANVGLRVFNQKIKSWIAHDLFGIDSNLICSLNSLSNESSLI
jgi:hypothetical protein